MKKTVSGTKSRGFFGEQVTKPMRIRRAKKSGDAEDDIKGLRALQQKAMEEQMAGAEDGGVIKRGVGYTKGLQKAWKLEQEYKEAKTGVKGRAGNIAKALGLVKDDKAADMISMMFGKKIPKEELQKQREKFGIKSDEEKKAEKEKAKAEKAAKTEESAKKRAERDQKINDIFDSVGKIYDTVNNIRLSVEGIANKLKAGPAKEVVAKEGKYFDPTGKRVRKGDIEKKAGLTYSKETKRYKDVKSGKFVGQGEAERRMNLSPSAKKISAAGAAVPGEKLATATPAAAPEATGLASKTLTDPTKADAGLEGIKAGEDAIIKKLDDQEKRSKSMFEFFDDPLGYLKKAFYGFIGALIGGTIGAGVGIFNIMKDYAWPKIKELVSDAWESLKKFLSDVHIRIPEIKFPEFSVFGHKIGGFTIIPKIDLQPFSFLAPKPVEATAEAPASAAAAPAPAPAAGPPPQGAGGAAAADVAAGTSEPGAPGAAQPSVAQAPGAPPTAAPAGSNMPGGAAPAKGGGGGAGMPSGYLGQAADFISKEEGLPKGGKAYWDPPGQNNLVSLGYGHQIKPEEYKQGFIQAGDEKISLSGDKGINTVLTKPQAIALLAADLPKYEERAAKPLGEAWNKLGDGQKAALISYAYNTGSTASLVKAGLKDAILSGDMNGAAKIISEKGIKTAGGKLFPPLAKRRQEESSLFASAAPPTAPGAAGAGGGSTGGAATAVASTAAPGATPAAAAQTAAPSAPSAPSATPVQPTPSTGQMLAKTTTDVSTAKEAAAAPAPAAPTIVAAATPTGPTKAIPPNNSSKANPRMAENAFVRAISKDFAHPSSFSSAVVV